VAQGVTAEALAIHAEVTNPATAPRGTATGGGQLMGLPLRLDIVALPEGAGARVERGLLEYGPARLTLNGLYEPEGPHLQGEAKLAVPDLAPFSRLVGQPIAGRVSAEAKGDSAGEWRIEIAAPALGAAGQEGRARLILNGQGARTRVALEAGNAAARLSLAATTVLAQPVVAEVQQLTIEGGGETLRLAAPAAHPRGRGRATRWRT
jgi:hypothetical protein